MSPPDSSGGGACHHNRPRPTTAENAAAAAKKLQVHPESTTARRQARRAALPRQRSTERVQELRLSLDGARRRGDHESARLLCAWIDAEFVADAHRRAVDPDLVRLRRQVRERAT